VVALFLVIKPFFSFTLFPLPPSLTTVKINHFSEPMLSSNSPVSLIYFPVCPSELSMSMLFVLTVLSVVYPPIMPGHDASAMKKRIFELPFINPPIRSNVLSDSVYFVIFEVTFKFSAICELDLAVPFFHPVHICGTHQSVIRQEFFSTTMVYVIFPKPLVSKSVSGLEFAISVSFIRGEISFINMPLRVFEGSCSVGFISDSFPLIN